MRYDLILDIFRWTRKLYCFDNINVSKPPQYYEKLYKIISMYNEKENSLKRGIFIMGVSVMEII